MIVHPKIYLRDQFRKMVIYGEGGWYMLEEKYVRDSVDNVE